MTGTMYQELLYQFQALTPMCNFEMPRVLCTDEELYYRRMYERTDEKLTSLVNLTTKEEDD